MDVEGVGMFDLVGTALDFLTRASSIVQAHYVERQSKILVINAPYWFSTLWAIVSPFMSQNTLDKVEILGEDYGERLRDFVDDASLPAIFGGSDTADFMASPEEELLREHVRKVNNGEDPFEKEEGKDREEEDEDFDVDDDELC